MSGILLSSAWKNTFRVKLSTHDALSRLWGSRTFAHPITTPWCRNRNRRDSHAAAPTTEAVPQTSDTVPASDGSFKSTAYPFTEIEAKWQAFWEEHQTFRTPEFKDLDISKPKFYALDMFPYPRYYSYEDRAI